MAVCAHDMVFEAMTGQIAGAGEPYVGREGLERYLEDVARVWKELRPSPEVYREGPDGLVVATGRVYAWGVGRVIDHPAGWVWQVRDGRIVRGRVFDSAGAALQAAGMTSATPRAE